MDVDNFSEREFEGLDLFRTICDFTQEMGESPGVEQLSNLKSEANDFRWDGVSIDSLAVSESLVVRLEPLELTAGQKMELLERRRVMTHGAVSDNLLSSCSYAQSKDEFAEEAETSLVTSHVAPEESASKRPRRSPRQKKSIQGSPLDDSPSCPGVAVRPYNLRKRSAPPVTEGRKSQTRALTPCVEAELETRAKTEQRVRRAREKIQESKSTELNMSVSRFVSGVDINGGALAYVDTQTAALERRSTRESNGRDYSAKNTGTWKREILATEIAPNRHPMNLSRESASAHYSKVVSRSTIPEDPRRTRPDWDEFFMLFNAIAAEAHKVRRLKTKKTQARCRWVSCMRNILNRAPI